jgi:hypothetical protein
MNRSRKVMIAAIVFLVDPPSRHLLVRRRPIQRDSPFAPEDGRVNLAAARGPIRGVEDRPRAGSPSRKTPRSGHLAKQSPLAFRDLTKNHKARGS